MSSTNSTARRVDLKLRITALNQRQLAYLGVDCYDTAADITALIGRRFYLVAREYRNSTTYLLCEDAGRTNMSHAPRVKGWLGTTDDVRAEALGYFEVIGRSSSHLHLEQIEADDAE